MRCSDINTNLHYPSGRRGLVGGSAEVAIVKASLCALTHVFTLLEFSRPGSSSVMARASVLSVRGK